MLDSTRLVGRGQTQDKRVPGLSSKSTTTVCWESLWATRIGAVANPSIELANSTGVLPRARGDHRDNAPGHARHQYVLAVVWHSGSTWSCPVCAPHISRSPPVSTTDPAPLSASRRDTTRNSATTGALDHDSRLTHTTEGETYCWGSAVRHQEWCVRCCAVKSYARKPCYTTDQTRSLPSTLTAPC